MISVVRLDFDHDCRDKAARFERLCEEIMDSCFNTRPLIVDRPVFSYRPGRNQLETMLENVGKQDAIVFLSEDRDACLRRRAFHVCRKG